MYVVMHSCTKSNSKFAKYTHNYYVLYVHTYVCTATEDQHPTAMYNSSTDRRILTLFCI